MAAASPSAGSPDPALTAALRRTPIRAVQILTRCLLERRPLAECAAFYGVSSPAFAALLARSLQELGRELGDTGPARPVEGPLAELSAALPPDLAGLSGLAARLWEAGTAALPAAADDDEAEESGLSRLLRVAILAALLASLVYAASALS